MRQSWLSTPWRSLHADELDAPELVVTSVEVPLTDVCTVVVTVTLDIKHSVFLVEVEDASVGIDETLVVAAAVALLHLDVTI